MLTGITFEGKIQLLAFCVFEACVGIFWPSMMKLRSQYVPEESRSTIINFFRIPLNLFVCIMLYNVSPPICLPLVALILFYMRLSIHACLLADLPSSACSLSIYILQNHHRLDATDGVPS